MVVRTRKGVSSSVGAHGVGAHGLPDPSDPTPAASELLPPARTSTLYSTVGLRMLVPTLLTGMSRGERGGRKAGKSENQGVVA